MQRASGGICYWLREVLAIKKVLDNRRDEICPLRESYEKTLLSRLVLRKVGVAIHRRTAGACKSGLRCHEC